MLELEHEDANTIASLFHVVSDLERIGDHAMNIAEEKEKYIRDQNKFSNDAFDEIKDIADETRKNIIAAIDMIKDNECDMNKLIAIEEREMNIDTKTELYKNNHIMRLNREECDVYAGIIFTKILTDLERIADHANNIAKSNKYKKMINSI